MENEKIQKNNNEQVKIQLTAEDIQYLCKPEYHEWMVATGRISEPILQVSKSTDGIEKSRTGSPPESTSEVAQEKLQKRRRSTAVVENIRDVFRQESVDGEQALRVRDKLKKLFSA